MENRERFIEIKKRLMENRKRFIEIKKRLMEIGLKYSCLEIEFILKTGKIYTFL
jgi:hypothetical protein